MAMVTRQSLSSPSRPVTVIRAKGAWSPVDLPLIWQFRDLLFAFATRDIRLRYRQTALGVLWVVLQPLLGAVIFAIVFGIIAKMPGDGLPYFVIAYSGLLGWTLFSGALTRIGNCFVNHRSLITKIFFPRLLLPLGTIPCVLLDLAVGLVLMAILMVVHGIAPGWNLLFLPVAVILLLGWALAIGLIAGSLAVSYRDIQHILPVVLQLWLFASPVGYSARFLPQKLQSLYYLNPLAAPIELFRWSLLGQGAPGFAHLPYSITLLLAFLTVAVLVFRTMERKFADVI